MRRSDLTLITRTRADLASGRARKARESAGLHQRAVASALGVTRQAVGHWESGRYAPSDEHALAYGRLLRDLAR